MIPMDIPIDPQLSKWLGAGLSVPSPLAGEGQGGGCHTAYSLGSIAEKAGILLRAVRTQHASLPGLPPSPALPRKGGGSAVCLGQAVQRRINGGGSLP